MNQSTPKDVPLVYVLLVAFAGVTPAMGDDAFGPDQVIAYKTVTLADGTTDELDLHVFNPPARQGSSRVPCAIFFFGGGWNGGTPSQFYPHCEYFAGRSMVAISVEYRTRNSHRAAPRDCVLDGKTAVRWVREHADRLGIDPDKIVVGGGSAGGHIAAAIAACGRLEEEISARPKTSCRPNALVLFNPVYDNGPGGYGHDRVIDYWKDISPLHNIHQGMPPTIVFFGTEDKHVPVATTKAFEAAMRQAGVVCDNHLYEGQPHGFFNFDRPGDTDYFADTVEKADEFLTSVGILKGKPSVDEFTKRWRTNRDD